MRRIEDADTMKDEQFAVTLQFTAPDQRFAVNLIEGLIATYQPKGWSRVELYRRLTGRNVILATWIPDDEELPAEKT